MMTYYKKTITLQNPAIASRHKIISLENQGSTKSVGFALSNPEAIGFQRQTAKKYFKLIKKY